MYTYIIVDDEHLIRGGIRNKIDSFGEALQLRCVGEANNGREAMALIAEVDPNIIVTDMRMPGIEGKELLSLLKQQYADKQMIVISGYKDYEYMMGAIEAQVTGYLLKPFSREEVRAVMEKAIMAINATAKSRSMQIRLDDMQAEQERLYEQADLDACRFLIESGSTDIDAIVFQSYKGRKLQELNSFGLYVLYLSEPILLVLGSRQEAAQSWQEKLMVKLSQSTKPFSQAGCMTMLGSGNGLIYMLIHMERTTNTEQRLALEQMISESVIELSDPVAAPISGVWLIGASSLKCDISKLNEAYLECRTAMEESTINYCGCSSYVQKSIKSAVKEEPRWRELDKLIYLLEAGSVNEAVRHLNEVLLLNSLQKAGKDYEADNFTVEQKALTWLQLKMRCNQLIAAIEFSGKQDLLLPGAEWGKHVESNVNAYYDPHMLVKYMSDLIAAIQLPTQNLSVDSTQRLVQSIKSYIELHYHEDLTLRKLSDRFFINTSYCSHIFKEKTGMTITEFILVNRMEKAKELLQRTDYPMDRIARQVGYNNEKYFFRIFKKATGFTP